MRRLMPKTARATRNKGQPRRRAKPLWRQPSLVGLVVLAVAAMSGGGSWWLWQTGWIQGLASKTKERLVVGTAEAGFAVSEIFVEGRMETGKAALLASLQLARGAPILALDLNQARARDCSSLGADGRNRTAITGRNSFKAGREAPSRAVAESGAILFDRHAGSPYPDFRYRPFQQSGRGRG